MKRFLKSLLICALALLMLSSCAFADSLFDLLPSEPAPSQTPQSSVAPSYGDFTGVMADEEAENKDGDSVVMYKNVSARQMEDFGEELQNLGYKVLEQQSQGNTIAYKLSNNTFTFTLFFDRADQSLRAVYPKGTAYAQSAFPGYIKVKLGDNFKIQGLGEFTFNSFIPCENLVDYRYSYKGKLDTTKRKSFSGYLIEFTYFNTSTSAKEFYTVFYDGMSGDSFVHNDLFKEAFVYKNDEDIYSYKAQHGGAYTGDCLRCDEVYRDIPSLETVERAISFNPPTGVKNSTDGTLGMTMDFPNGEKYVLMLRENGVNLY